MAKNKQKLKERNAKIIELVDQEVNDLKEGSLFSRFDIAIERVSKTMYLQPSTVRHIYKQYGNYGN